MTRGAGPFIRFADIFSTEGEHIPAESAHSLTPYASHLTKLPQRNQNANSTRRGLL